MLIFPTKFYILTDNLFGIFWYFVDAEIFSGSAKMVENWNQCSDNISNIELILKLLKFQENF